jgi:hypothetical protein
MFPRRGSGEMLNDKLNAQVSFTTAAVAPPDATTPEQVLRHHRSVQGRYGGTGSCPLLHSYQHPEFHINAKGILQIQKELFFNSTCIDSVHISSTHAMHECHASLYYFTGTGNQMRKIRANHSLIPLTGSSECRDSIKEDPASYFTPDHREQHSRIFRYCI